jgi:hypothetical protein
MLKWGLLDREVLPNHSNQNQMLFAGFNKRRSADPRNLNSFQPFYLNALSSDYLFSGLSCDRQALPFRFIALPYDYANYLARWGSL